MQLRIRYKQTYTPHNEISIVNDNGELDTTLTNFKVYEEERIGKANRVILNGPLHYPNQRLISMEEMMNLILIYSKKIREKSKLTHEESKNCLVERLNPQIFTRAEDSTNNLILGDCMVYSSNVREKGFKLDLNSPSLKFMMHEQLITKKEKGYVSIDISEDHYDKLPGEINGCRLAFDFEELSLLNSRSEDKKEKKQRLEREILISLARGNEDLVDEYLKILQLRFTSQKYFKRNFEKGDLAFGLDFIRYGWNCFKKTENAKMYPLVLQTHDYNRSSLGLFDRYSNMLITPHTTLLVPSDYSGLKGQL